MKILELCAKLKQKRQELGYSIEDVVEKTKLYPSTIRDLEEGNLENISPVYLKGFIKIYASFLGIDISEFIKQDVSYLKIKEPIKTDKKLNLLKLLHFISTLNIPLKIKKIIFFGFLLIVILFTISKIGNYLIGKKKIYKEEQQKVLPSKEDSKPLVSAQTPAEITVTLTAKKKCFIRVKIDDKIFFDGAIEKGVIETWKASRELELSISDGSAVYIEVNGKPLPQLTSVPKKIKSLKIDNTGMISVDK